MDFLYSKTPLYFFTQSLWRDEAFSYLLAVRPLGQILSLTAQDSNPPLYYLFLHWWIKIFGTSELALRSLSLVFFAATVILLIDFLREIFKLRTLKVLIYMVLFLFHPLISYYAFEARMYSLVGFLSVFSFYSFYKKRFCLYVLTLIAGLYTHYFFFLVILAQLMYAVIYRSRNFFNKILIALMLALVFYTPWFLYIVRNNPSFDSFWLEKPVWQDLFYLPSLLFTGYEKSFGLTNYGRIGYTPFILLINIFLLFIIIWGVVKLKNRSLTFLLLFWSFIPPLFLWLASLLSFSYFLPRYFIASAYGLFLLFILLVDHLPKAFSFMAIIIIFYLMFSYQNLNIKYRKKYDFARLSLQIKNQLLPADVIYVTSEKDFHLAQYYFGENKVFIFGKSYQDIPWYVGKVLITPESIKSTLPHFPSRAFIISYNNGYIIRSR